MKKHINFVLLSALALPLHLASAQGTVPTFQHTIAGSSYTLVGNNPAQAAITTIPTTLVPVTLNFETGTSGNKQVVMDAGPDVPRVLSSPIFSRYAFATGGETQYADAMLRTTFPGQEGWHTLLDKPTIKPVRIDVPVSDGYILSSKKTGGLIAVVDADYVQDQLFKQLGKEDGQLVIAMTHNTTFYADKDATICCTWGTHGIDAKTGDSFVLGSYLQGTPTIVQARDIQPVTQQLAEFINDPWHDPQRYGYNVTAPGNTVPAWMRADRRNGCGGTGISSSYFLLEPTDTNPKNNIPTSPAFVAHTREADYHLENAALLPWYVGKAEGLGTTFSFPDAGALSGAALPCNAHGRRASTQKPALKAEAAPSNSPKNGHELIGYWTGHGVDGNPLSLRDVSPQWDVIIVAFAAPVKNGPEGTLLFRVPKGIEPARFKEDVRYLKSRGKKVMISLGGGGAYFSLADAANIHNFVDSVSRVVSEYGFEGVDIDFESPSLLIQVGDLNFKHPKTPSIVNLITGLRQLHHTFGPQFMISLVPEGPQFPAGFRSYGGQFGSYLPIAYALRDILSFVDVQDYNTPPLEGLDGEIYQSHTVDYHAAVTELMLHGFNVGGNHDQLFPAMPAAQVAVGFLTDYTTPDLVSQSLKYILTGKAPAGTSYRLDAASGYPDMLGAMFWTIDDDLSNNYEFSNLIGPQLHSYPARR